MRVYIMHGGRRHSATMPEVPLPGDEVTIALPGAQPSPWKVDKRLWLVGANGQTEVELHCI